MDYWSKSFGFYLALGASGFYFVFLALFFIIDHYTVPKILQRIIARVKRLELKGFKQKEAKKLTVYRDEKGKIVFIRHDKKKDENGKTIEGGPGDNKDKKGEGDIVVQEEDQVIELKKGAIKGDLDEKGKKFGDEENVAEAFLTPAKVKKRGKASGILDESMRKPFKDEEDDVSQVLKGKKGSTEEISSDGEKKKKKKKNKGEDEGYINENGEYVIDDNGGESGEQEPSSEPESEDPEVAQAKKKAENDLIEQ